VHGGDPVFSGASRVQEFFMQENKETKVPAVTADYR
jgi:hypothetical protein